MIELGSNRLVPGFEEQLSGAQAGEERTVTVQFPDDYGAEDLKGREAQFAVTVKEIKEKQLPPLDDDLAIEAGFDTLDELRTDIRERLTEQQTAQIEAEFREAALDSAVAGATVDVPEALVEARSQELWDQMSHSLSHQGISKDAYLRISGRTEEQIVAEGSEDARRSLEREAVLAAVVEAESIEPSEEEVLEAVERMTGRRPNAKALARLRDSGRLDGVKTDLAQRHALDLIAESATPLSVDQAKARDKLWTPGQDRPTGTSQLWTPGS
jgi:trigger factor